MFQPSYFKQTGTQQMFRFIQEYPLATLVSASSNGLVGNHIPMLVVERDGAYFLQGHVAQANGLWQDVDSSTDVLAIFHGPDAYISPSWYPTKKTDPKTVPTWNYVAVHVTGQIKFFHDKVWLKQHLKNLSDAHEKRVNESWQLSDAPVDYINKMLKAIVGVEIVITDIKGNTKMSQNQSQANREGVVAGLSALGETEAANWVENPNPIISE